MARAEGERRAAVNGSGGGDDAPTAETALAGVTRNICADTRTIALFKEPFEGCMTTAVRVFDFCACFFSFLHFFRFARALSFSFSLASSFPKQKNLPQTQEAIARALAELEPTQAPAAAVLSALNAVVDSQKRHDPAVRARCGIEEEAGEDAKELRGNAGRGESWHRGLHERRER